MLNRPIENIEVILVNMEMEYWKDIHSYASLPEVSKYQQWGPNTEEDTLTYVKQIMEDITKEQPSRYVYAIKKISSDKVIGAAELFHLNQINKCAEIGYVVHPDYWGMGIGTLAANKLLEIGFSNLHLHRIYAKCDARNIGSAKVLEKVGMTLEGKRRHDMLLETGWRDSLLYSILDNEWKGMNKNGANNTRLTGAIHQGT